MVGRVKDNWKVLYHKGTSLLHVVDKFSISLQFDRYTLMLIDTSLLFVIHIYYSCKHLSCYFSVFYLCVVFFAT